MKTTDKLSYGHLATIQSLSDRLDKLYLKNLDVPLSGSNGTVHEQLGVALAALETILQDY